MKVKVWYWPHSYVWAASPTNGVCLSIQWECLGWATKIIFILRDIIKINLVFRRFVVKRKQQEDQFVLDYNCYHLENKTISVISNYINYCYFQESGYFNVISNIWMKWFFCWDINFARRTLWWGNHGFFGWYNVKIPLVLVDRLSNVLACFQNMAHTSQLTFSPWLKTSLNLSVTLHVFRNKFYFSITIHYKMSSK